MGIIDITLIVLETLTVIIFGAYVLHHKKYFIGKGPERTYNLYLRSVWITYIAVTLLCINLIWGRVNIVLGLNNSLSNTIREVVLILTLVHLAFAGWTHRDIWQNKD